jgi:hypothetical protein
MFGHPHATLRRSRLSTSSLLSIISSDDSQTTFDLMDHCTIGQASLSRLDLPKRGPHSGDCKSRSQWIHHHLRLRRRTLVATVRCHDSRCLRLSSLLVQHAPRSALYTPQDAWAETSISVTSGQPCYCSSLQQLGRVGASPRRAAMSRRHAGLLGSWRTHAFTTLFHPNSMAHHQWVRIGRSDFPFLLPFHDLQVANT